MEPSTWIWVDSKTWKVSLQKEGRFHLRQFPSFLSFSSLHFIFPLCIAQTLQWCFQLPKSATKCFKICVICFVSPLLSPRPHHLKYCGRTDRKTEHTGCSSHFFVQTYQHINTVELLLDLYTPVIQPSKYLLKASSNSENLRFKTLGKKHPPMYNISEPVILASNLLRM